MRELCVYKRLTYKLEAFRLESTDRGRSYINNSNLYYQSLLFATSTYILLSSARDEQL